MVQNRGRTRSRARTAGPGGAVSSTSNRLALRSDAPSQKRRQATCSTHGQDARIGRTQRQVTVGGSGVRVRTREWGIRFVTRFASSTLLCEMGERP